MKRYSSDAMPILFMVMAVWWVLAVLLWLVAEARSH